MLKVFHVLVVRVWKVAEGEDLLRLVTAGVGSVVDLDDVRKLKGVELLTQRHPARHSLLGIRHDFIPKDLAGNWKDLIGIAPREVDASGLEVLLSRDQALRREFVIAEGAEKL